VPALNILVTAASRRVPLVRAFQRALRDLSPGGRVIASDVSALSPAVHVADAAFEVPLSNAPEYIDAILALCDQESVGLVVPTIDDELPVFGAAADRFRSAGIVVAVSPLSTTALCHDKYETCRFLRARGVAAAESFLPRRLPKSPRFPLFVKPRFGRGGVGAVRVDNARQLEFFLGYVKKPVVQQFLDGREFTIDLFCDLSGHAISAVPRERVVIRAGVIDRGRTVHDPGLLSLALACGRTLEFAGAVNIQCRVVDGVPTVFEINPRFSGGIHLTVEAGADFPRWLVELALGREVRPALGAFTDELWMTSYETAIFLADGGRDVLRPLNQRHPPEAKGP
jgi:carbamoyl-phosphate synthase large subunit